MILNILKIYEYKKIITVFHNIRFDFAGVTILYVFFYRLTSPLTRFFAL